MDPGSRSRGGAFGDIGVTLFTSDVVPTELPPFRTYGNEMHSIAIDDGKGFFFFALGDFVGVAEEIPLEVFLKAVVS